MIDTAGGPKSGLPPHLCARARARALSRSPLSKPQISGVPQHADGLGARPGGGEAGGVGETTAAEPAPGTPAPRRSLQAGATPGSPQSWAPPGPPVRRLEGPGEPGSGELIHSGFQSPGPVPGDRAGQWEASPLTTPAPPRGSLGQRWEGSLALGVAARAARPLLPVSAPPCLRPAPVFQSGFCGARRPAPGLRAPRGGWLRARRGWRCAPPRLHCCAPGVQGSHAPHAPRSRPPQGSAVRRHGPRERPGLGLWAEALKAAPTPARPWGLAPGPSTRPRPWPSGPACGQRSWA